MEVIGIILALVATYIAYITYKKTFPNKLPEPTEEKANLKLHFKMNQALSIEIQYLLQKQIDLGYGEMIMFDTYTFNKYLAFVKSEYESGLSESAYQNLDILPINKFHIESMLESLNLQFQNLQKVRNQLKLL